MIKTKLKKQYIPFLIAIFVLVPAFAFLFLVNNYLEATPENIDYVTEETPDETIPVINTTKTIINPYVDTNVTIGKSYYNYKGSEEDQLNSILIHDDTYIQNTGIDFVSDTSFEVVAVLDGTVINVKDDESLGKIVEIKHENGLVSAYQSLTDITVKKGDIIGQGQTIGSSGTNEIEKDLGNHLHFEIYKNGQAVNPLDYLNKELSLKEE